MNKNAAETENRGGGSGGMLEYLVDLNDRERAVLLEYRLIEPDDSLVETYLERPEGKPLGLGPKAEAAVIKRLIEADETQDQEWLQWIFFEAGGGHQAMDASTRAFEQTKQRFIDERVNGFKNPDTKEGYMPISREEAEKRWKAVEPSWRNILVSADQDIVEHLGAFGYSRAWPGHNRRYARVVDAVKKFFALRQDILRMNEERAGHVAEPVKLTPQDYPNLAEMERASRKVERYFASKKAREDIEAVQIYEDDLVRAICPLTYAASVRYGFDNWPFANQAVFEEILGREHSFRNAWKSTTERAVLVYFYWKVPMPSWIVRKSGKFERFELVNLAMEIPLMNLKQDLGDVVFHDEENVATLSRKLIQKLITDEPTRPADPQDEEMPVKHGPNAYNTQGDADLRLNAFSKALDSVQKWAAGFDSTRLKSNVFTEELSGGPLDDTAQDEPQASGD